MFTKLVVPLDGTPESASALPPARTIARLFGARVVLLQVVDVGEDSPETRLAAARSYLHRIAEEMSGDGTTVETVVTHEEVGEGIVRQAGEPGDAIVMATHGRGGFNRAVLGSVTEYVVGHAAVPMLLVRPGEKRLERVGVLIAPVDTSDVSSHALTALEAVAKTAGATVVLVQVTVPLTRYGRGRAIDPGWEDRMVAEAQEHLDRIAASLRDRGVPTVGRALLGQVGPTIRQAADDADADLIVMGTHGTTGPARAILGSVADEITRTARQPVLLIPARAPVDGPTATGAGHVTHT